MKNLRDELCSIRLCGEVIVEAMLTEFYIETLRLICRGAENESREKSEAVVDSVHNRYYNIEMWFGKRFSENVTEEDLARELNLSKRQLSRNLREIYGMSFREKLCDVRVHNAVKLLTRTDSSVERIAAASGATVSSLREIQHLPAAEVWNICILSFSAECSISGLQEFLAGVDNHEPRLYWRNLTLRPDNTNAPAKVMLDGQLALLHIPEEEE